MTTEIVRTERRGKVLEITLDRPPANAINRETSRALYAAAKELEDDPELMVGVIVGAGERIFSGGWDLKEAASGESDLLLEADPVHGHGPGGFAGITEYWDLQKPLIAAVNGAAVGGGFELALACDLIVMAETAFFQLPEMRRGLLADAGALQRLPRRVPYSVAVDMLYTGRRMQPAEAERWGLVNRIVPLDGLMDAARELAAEVAKGAPLAVRALKEVLHHIESMPLRDAMAATKPGRSGLPLYERMSRSEDLLEGARAFTEKREPRWKGR